MHGPSGARRRREIANRENEQLPALLKRGARNEALHEYQQTLLYAPPDPKIRQPIEAQIQRFAGDPHAKIPYLRNPFME